MKLDAVLVALLIGGVAYAVSESYGDQGSAGRFLLAGSLSVWVYALWRLTWCRREHIIMLCFALFNVFGLIFPGMIQSATGYFPWLGLSYPQDTLNFAAFLVLTYSVSVCGGYLVSYPRTSVTTSDPLPPRKLSKSRVFAGVVVLSVLSISLVFAIGPQYFLEQRSYVTELIDATSALSPSFVILISVVRNLGFSAMVLTIVLSLSWRVTLPVLPVILLLGSIVFLVTNNPLNESRFGFLGFVIALLVIAFETRRPIFKALFVGGYAIGLLVLMPILNTLSRGAGEEVFVDFFDVYRSSLDFDGVQSIMNVLLWIETTGLRLGFQLLSCVLFFVPSTIWGAKAAPTGVAAAEYMGYSITNISSPLPSEFYADFGLSGVIVISATVGRLCAYLDSRLGWAGASGVHLSKLPYAVIAGYAAILVRGPLLGIVGPVIAALLMAFVIVKLCVHPLGSAPGERTQNPHE
jgi:oligosaccharide repeat unit polymerase